MITIGKMVIRPQFIEVTLDGTREDFEATGMPQLTDLPGELTSVIMRLDGGSATERIDVKALAIELLNKFEVE